MGVSPVAAFGPYRLDGVIASSDVATVYRATDTRHGGREVALKLFGPELSADPAFQERFHRDVALLGVLRPPNVVPVHSYGVLDGAVYLDMRLIEGRSLGEIRRRGGLDAYRGVRVAEQLTGALAVLHAGGFGPRCIRPDEVVLSGAAGSEFVHLVGLGLGRPPVAGWPDVAALVGPPAVSRSRRWWTVAAALTALVVVAAVIVWVSGSGRRNPSAPQVAAWHAGSPVVAAAIGTVRGESVLVAATAEAIRSWYLADGSSAGPPIPVEAEAVETAEVDGDPVVVSRGTDQLVRTHRLTDGRELGRPIGTAEPARRPDGLPGLPRDIATGDLAGRTVVAAVQPARPGSEPHPALAYAVWAVPDGGPVGAPVIPGDSTLLRLQTATIDGVTAVLSLGDDTRIYDHDAPTGAPTGGPIEPGAPVSVFDVVDDGSDPVVVTGGTDNTVRVFDLRTGNPVGPVRKGHSGRVTTVETVAWDGGTLVVSVAGDPVRPEARFWDLESGEPVGPVLAGHPVAAGTLVAGEVDGEGVLVTAAAGDVAVWDVAALLGGGAS
jgi:hypothetical protein